MRYVNDEFGDEYRAEDLRAQAELLRLCEVGARMQWVPVSVRLPWIDKMVLCYGDGGAVLTGYYYDGWHTGRLNWRITHWMPLPQPPQDGDNNG